MERLNLQYLKSGKVPADINVGPTEDYPEKIVQFGEGVFLRAFVDWMVNRMNSKGLFKGKVVIVQPIATGRIDEINAQDGLYTLFLRGLEKGKVINQKEIITSVSRGINPYANWDEYIKLAKSPDIRFIISNTTEAGIAYNPDDKPEDTPPASFPAKVTVFLYTRFKEFGGDPAKGLIIVPCELIDRNGDNLKKIVLRYAEEWNLGSEFISWVNNSNYFLNTLVDRIVTGFPRDEYKQYCEELGYEDTNLDTAEIFHLWCIEGDKKLAEELPLHKAGLNVVWTDNLEPYRTRKVRILNGAHTMTVLASYLMGKNTVKECMDDETILAYMRKGIYEEIIPTFDLPENEKKEFAEAVQERFSNPFIKHYLLSISLNSVSKFKTRNLVSLMDYIERKGQLPQVLCFALAALIAFYKGETIEGNALIGQRGEESYKIVDDMSVLEFFRKVWGEFDGKDYRTVAQKVLGNTAFWGRDLNEVEGMTDLVAADLSDIMTNGPRAAMESLLAGARVKA